MTKATHFVALLQSHIDGDEEQFLTVAMQAAANEARLGHGKVAQQLREMVDDARARGKAKGRGRAVPLVQPRGALATSSGRPSSTAISTARSASSSVMSSGVRPIRSSIPVLASMLPSKG